MSSGALTDRKSWVVVATLLLIFTLTNICSTNKSATTQPHNLQSPQESTSTTVKPLTRNAFTCGWSEYISYTRALFPDFNVVTAPYTPGTSTNITDVLVASHNCDFHKFAGRVLYINGEPTFNGRK